MAEATLGYTGLKPADLGSVAHGWKMKVLFVIKYLESEASTPANKRTHNIAGNQTTAAAKIGENWVRESQESAWNGLNMKKQNGIDMKKALKGSAMMAASQYMII